MTVTEPSLLNVACRRKRAVLGVSHVNSPDRRKPANATHNAAFDVDTVEIISGFVDDFVKDWSCEGEPKFLDSFAVDPFRAADDPFNDGIVEDRSVETSFNVC